MVLCTLPLQALANPMMVPCISINYNKSHCTLQRIEGHSALYDTEAVWLYYKFKCFFFYDILLLLLFNILTKWLFLFVVSLVARLSVTNGITTCLYCKLNTLKGKFEAYLIVVIRCWLFVSSEALDALGLKRYCCRRMVLTHVDLIEKLLHYNRK